VRSRHSNNIFFNAGYYLQQHNFNNIKVLSIIKFLFIVCPTTLPEYNNAVITSGDGQANYFHGNMLVYMCDTNFGTTAKYYMYVWYNWPY